MTQFSEQLDHPTDDSFLKTQSDYAQNLKIQQTPLMLPIKQSQNLLSSQTFLYLTITYFLAIALFYLILSLTRYKYVFCQLSCTNLTCSCKLRTRISWSNPTYIQLSWQQAKMISTIVNNSQIQSTKIYNNYSSFDVELQDQLEVSCFPSTCQVLLGVIQREIGDNSSYEINFNNIIPFGNDQQLKAVFREVNPNYPQLSTQAQLAINVVFAILIGIVTFLRKNVLVQYNAKQKILFDQKQKEKINWETKIPTNILKMNMKLQESIAKAQKILGIFSIESEQQIFIQE